MTKDQAKGFKGILAIVVMMHHILQWAGFSSLFASSPKIVQSIEGTALEQMGVISVASFFFLSGFGLRFSVERGGVGYARSMFARKIVPLYTIVVIVSIIYFLIFIAIGEPKESHELLQSLGFGGTIIVNGWFLQVILMVYILFACLYSFEFVAHRACVRGGCLDCSCDRGLLPLERFV